MLTFAEEIVLLNLDDETGKFLRGSGGTLGYPLAASILMDLALRSKIDADLEKIFVVDPIPTGEVLLDGTLAEIEASDDEQTPDYWISRLAERGEEIQSATIARLIARGILRQEEHRFLWVLKTRRYPMIDGQEEMEIKLRLIGVLLNDAIPSPRDAALISLVAACGLVTTILSAREAERIKDRIRSIRDLDLIGHAMNESLRRLREAIEKVRAENIGFPG